MSTIASQNAAAASGISTPDGLGHEPRCGREPGADVHTSNHASASSSAPPAAAVTAALTSARASSTRVDSAAREPRPQSRPVQASDQFCARAVVGSVDGQQHAPRQQEAPDPERDQPGASQEDRLRRPVTSPCSGQQSAEAQVACWSVPSPVARVNGRERLCLHGLTVGLQTKFCKLIFAESYLRFLVRCLHGDQLTTGDRRRETLEGACPTRCAGKCCATCGSTAPPAPPRWPRRSPRAPEPPAITCGYSPMPGSSRRYQGSRTAANDGGARVLVDHARA